MKKLIIATLIVLSQVPAYSSKHVYNWIVETGIKHPKIVYAQYVLETGHGKSNAAREKCNLFGFMYKGKIMKFNTQYDSVLYYKKWQTQRYKGGDYYKFLTEIGYASDPIYIQKLKKIKVP